PWGCQALGGAMPALRHTAFVLALALVTGCAMTGRHDDLTSSADTLASKAHAFAQTTDNAPGQGPAADSTYARDVHSLADQPEDFRRVVASKHAGDIGVKAAFDTLSQTYLMVNGEVDRSHSEWTQQSWRAVHAAFADLQHQMSGYG